MAVTDVNAARMARLGVRTTETDTSEVMYAMRDLSRNASLVAVSLKGMSEEARAVTKMAGVFGKRLKRRLK